MCQLRPNWKLEPASSLPPTVCDPGCQPVENCPALGLVPKRRAAQEGLTEANRIWQARLYDFNVWSERKRIEKLRYMHRNPVKRGLAEGPDARLWSSFRSYAYGEPGAVRISDVSVLEMKVTGRPRELCTETA